MKKKIVSKNREQGQKLSNAWRFILLPLATLLYGYGLMSFGVLFAILIVYIVRRDFGSFQGVTFEFLLTIIIGVIIFFPARKFRKNMMDNS